MNRFLLLSLLLLSFSAFAQQTAYQVFEVDSTAEPRGGVAVLNTYIQANLRKPTAAEAEGKGGRVVISSIVEPDGSVSDVKILSGIRPDCDREALRVIKNFSAWKPALKGGKAVRQQMTTSVVFKPNPPFIYRNGAQIRYFDADRKLLADSSDKARFKQAYPLDSIGLPNGDMIVYKAKGSGWKEEYRIPFSRERNKPTSYTDQPTTTVGYRNDSKLWDGKTFLLTESGSVLRQSYYKNGIPTGASIDYHPNGLVAKKTDEVDDGLLVTSWYPTGQIKEIRLNKKLKAMVVQSPNLVTAFWAPEGKQLVTNGNGKALYTDLVQSRADSTQKTAFTEQGVYENGAKQGVWTGRYADGSYFYQELYDKGVCQQGKAFTAGSDTLRYTELDHQPEFPGGMSGLGQFLSQNLRYPVNAHKAGAQGKVFVSFVVCTDGTLCDYEVLNDVHPELDQEAIRVVQKMSGHWKPGVQRGQKVRVKYNLPINFTLQ
ncbi:TonB family protein [Spirosoma agri]|uniref:TonB family protein n=1 Tax=Spirosoma agri TaxID=1987381 RepID=A0A6M0IMA9_9BACT|nr:TonB family protein [Spirosoma agri]NEU68952.1 TonB family protein [Spirosoma agri]